MSGKLFELRNIQGGSYGYTAHPAAVIDLNMRTTLSVGDYDKILVYYNNLMDKFERNGRLDRLESTKFMEIPKNQTEVDKAFQDDTYMAQLYNHQKRGVK